MIKKIIFPILMILVFLIFEGCYKTIIPYKKDSIPVGKIKFAGARSSSYGIHPFPEPEGWQYAMNEMCKCYRGAEPCAIWIVGILKRPKKCYLQFPSDGKKYENVVFDSTDRHERYLDYFDSTGIKVFLQVEPACADVENLIDLVLNRYEHYSCVIGVGVDVEWHRESENRGWGVKVKDEDAEAWEKKVKSYDPDYRLFLKHWDRRWMPPNYRGDLIFVSDSQMLKSFGKMLNEFSDYWADYFKPNTVSFQIGYASDHKWWGKLENPPRDIGIAIAQKIEQQCYIFWVDFTLTDVLPLSK